MLYPQLPAQSHTKATHAKLTSTLKTSPVKPTSARKTTPAKTTSASKKTTPAKKAADNNLQSPPSETAPAAAAGSSNPSEREQAASVAITLTRASLRSAPEKTTDDRPTSKDAMTADVSEAAVNTRWRKAAVSSVSSAGRRSVNSDLTTAAESKMEVRGFDVCEEWY